MGKKPNYTLKARSQWWESVTSEVTTERAKPKPKPTPARKPKAVVTKHQAKTKPTAPARPTHVIVRPASSGLKVYALGDDERSDIMLTMNKAQLKVLEKYTMLKIRSTFHTNRYLENTDWAFYGLRIDYGYQRSDWTGHHRREELHCDCGRRIKFQYEIRSVKTGKKHYLGIKHFCDHLGIPQSVANEIKNGVNKINIYQDEILVLWRRGVRFPDALYQRALRLGVLDDGKSAKLAQRCADYGEVDLPLFHNDQAALERLVSQRESELFAEQNQLQRAVRQVHDQMYGTPHQASVTSGGAQAAEKDLRRPAGESTPGAKRAYRDAGPAFRPESAAEHGGATSHREAAPVWRGTPLMAGQVNLVSAVSLTATPTDVYERLVVTQNAINRDLLGLMGRTEFGKWLPDLVESVIEPTNALRSQRLWPGFPAKVQKRLDAVLAKIARLTALSAADLAEVAATKKEQSVRNVTPPRTVLKQPAAGKKVRAAAPERVTPAVVAQRLARLRRLKSFLEAKARSGQPAGTKAVRHRIRKKLALAEQYAGSASPGFENLMTQLGQEIRDL
ncbi:hypothetical protein [Lacticaseibacillus kribbianus]|uniref:hypothetical protein n=1 Tax=Lacticaseibacillus kribbianus TaxID=2926292 RepID=UPI001CD2FCE4|nr:hypothetical protein [Lacticaseibacillus kribbianus]